jgi:hypothetical protein
MIGFLFKNYMLHFIHLLLPINMTAQWRTQDQNSWGAKKPRYKIKQDGKNYSCIKFKFHIYQYNIQVQRSEANIQLSSS